MVTVLAFLGNLSVTETVLILVVAILIFGRDLPQVAGKAYLQVRKLRRVFDDMRRETGIDQEIRNMERTFRDVSQEVDINPSVPHTPARQQLPRGQEKALDREKAEASPEVLEQPAGCEREATTGES